MARRPPPKPSKLRRKPAGASPPATAPARSGGHAPRPAGPRPARGPSAPRNDATRPRERRPRADAPIEASGEDRLQKVLAHAGLGSRRSCEELILQGRVSVDGTIVRELGTKVTPAAKILVDGQPVRSEKLVYFAVHKPRHVVSTNNDPARRTRVIDLLPDLPQRVYAVGRLDENSTGLMLLTNDGNLANRLTHPKFGIEKVYRAVVAGKVEPDVIDKLIQGVWLAEGKARAKRARIAGGVGDATVLELVLAEGKNREVRRMLAKLGHKVMTLTRVAVGPITVKGLRPGEWRELTGREIGLLKDLASGKEIATAWFDDRPMRQRPPGRGPARASRPPTNEPPPRDRAATTSVPPSQRSRPVIPTGPRADREPIPTGPRARRPVGPAAPRPTRRIVGLEDSEGPGTRGPRPPGPRPGRRPAGRRADGPPPRRVGENAAAAEIPNAAHSVRRRTSRPAPAPAPNSQRPRPRPGPRPRPPISRRPRRNEE